MSKVYGPVSIWGRSWRLGGPQEQSCKGRGPFTILGRNPALIRRDPLLTSIRLYGYQMHVHIFGSITWPSVKAFTSDETGANLPTDYSPWRQGKNARATKIDSLSNPIAVMIRRYGYFLLFGGVSYSRARRKNH
jgi:hypothetical protein